MLTKNSIPTLFSEMNLHVWWICWDKLYFVRQCSYSHSWFHIFPADNLISLKECYPQPITLHQSILSVDAIIGRVQMERSDRIFANLPPSCTDQFQLLQIHFSSLWTAIVAIWILTSHVRLVSWLLSFNTFCNLHSLSIAPWDIYGVSCQSRWTFNWRPTNLVK